MVLPLASIVFEPNRPRFFFFFLQQKRKGGGGQLFQIFTQGRTYINTFVFFYSQKYKASSN